MTESENKSLKNDIANNQRFIEIVFKTTFGAIVIIFRLAFFRKEG